MIQKKNTWPIQFSQPMILALLEGRKTMTRRKAWTIRQDGKSVPRHWRRLAAGERLWVQEPLAISGDVNPWPLSDWKAPDILFGDKVVYRAGANGYDVANQDWHPARHMPRWASRITLLVTSLRVERLHAIPPEDVAREGVMVMEGQTPIEAFRSLWDDLHGAAAWLDNPEVAVISFSVIPKNIDRWDWEKFNRQAELAKEKPREP